VIGSRDKLWAWEMELELLWDLGWGSALQLLWNLRH